MLIKGIVAEDFINYKYPSMFIIFPYCNFKCEKDCGKPGICQNSDVIKQKNIEISYEDIVNFYLKNDITKALVLGGLEPFDSFNDLKNLITYFRSKTSDAVVIYTGYDKEEIIKQVTELKNSFSNIIIKFGRFIPDQKSHFDEVLGVYLASDNQKGEKIS